MKKILALHALFIFLLPSGGQFGIPDPDFDGDGMLQLNSNDSSSEAYAVIALHDNTILIAGYAYNGHDMDFALARVNPDGSPDNSFGTSGLVLTDFSTNDDMATSMKVQEDGRIVLGGLANNGNAFAIARYNPDGSLDTTFSSDGKVTPASGIRVDFGPSLLLQDDGKIIIAGTDYIDSDYYCSMVRYTSAGTIDNTFTPDKYAVKGLFNCATLQSDGKILVAGQVSNGSGVDLILARFNTDGTMDTGFSFDGKVTYDVWPYDIANCLVVQNDQKIIAAGYYGGAYFGIEVLRYKTEGLLDESFANAGMYTYQDPDMNSHQTYSVLVQPDNKIVLGGTGYDNIYGSGIELLRLEEEGSPDTTFGTGGKVITPVYPYGNVYSLDIQPDGKILAGGYSYIAENRVMTVFRYSSGLLPLETQSYDNEQYIQVYPNPFVSDLTLSFSGLGENPHLEIISLDGRIVFSLHSTQENQQIHTESIPSGLYVLRLTSPDISFTRLIMKQ